MKALIIEDEPDLLRSIAQYLKKEGMICEQASDRASAEDKLALHQYEVAVLDILLPDGNGFDILEILKKDHPATGILIVSAKDSLDDKLRGFSLGADDYITKPFHLAELNARVNAVIRNRNFQGGHTIDFHEITLDHEGRSVLVHGHPLDLTRKEFDLLEFFLTNKERVLTREAIAERLWGDYMDMSDNYDLIYTHIKNLRGKILEVGGKDHLKTVYGIGYKFGETP